MRTPNFAERMRQNRMDRSFSNRDSPETLQDDKEDKDFRSLPEEQDAEPKIKPTGFPSGPAQFLRSEISILTICPKLKHFVPI